MGRRRVAYVNWDGFAWGYYEEAMRRPGAYPALARLTAEGTVFARASTGLPSLTTAMQTSLVTGAWPAIHQNTFRYLDRAAGLVRESGRRNEAETVAEACRRQGLRVGAVNQFTLKGRGTAPQDPENPYLDAGRHAPGRFRWARRLWDLVSPDLLCLYCDELDAAGHNESRPAVFRREPHRRARIMRQLQRLDGELARWLEALSPTGPASGAVLALATDHGMTPYSGPSSLPSLLKSLTSLGLPVEVCGPGRKPGLEDGVVIVTAGLELQLFFVGTPGRGDLARDRTARRVVQALSGEPYFGGALGRAELRQRGAHPDFADLLLWPKPPHHFKLGPGRYLARGQHDSPDPSSAHVFLALWGDGIRPGHRVENPVRIIDLAPTLANLLSIAPPGQARGRVLREAFLP